MTSPAVSVVIPCYNLGQYLDEAVDSVLSQTFQDFEILIVDDGLTDPSTMSLLQGYVRPRTQVIRTTNRGLSAARNAGIAATTGRYLCMLDADDKLAPQYMERSVSTLDTNPDLAFASHWLRTFGDETGDWMPERCDFPALLDKNTVNGAALVRREAAVAVGGFDEQMRHGCEDWDFWIGLVERGHLGRIIPEVLFHYRRRPHSMSRLMAQNPGHPELYRQMIRKHPDSFRAHLPALIARRERHIGFLERHVEDLQFDHYERLGPELAKRRDDVEILTRRVERQQKARERQALEELTAHLLEEQRLLTAELAQARNEAVTATRDALEYHARTNRAEREIDQLRGSGSWRVTYPLRAIVDLWHWASGRRP